MLKPIRSSRLATAVAVLALALVAPTAASAAPAFLPSQDVTSLTQSNSEPLVDFNSSGDAVFAALDTVDAGKSAYRVGVRPAGGQIAVQTLPAGGSVSVPATSKADLDLANSGRAVVAWTQTDGVYFARRAPSGSFGSPQKLGVTQSQQDGVFDVDVGIDDAGNVTFAWATATGTAPNRTAVMRTVVLTDAGALVSAATLEQITGPVGLSAPNVVVNGGGRAVLTFLDGDIVPTGAFTFRDFPLGGFGPPIHSNAPVSAALSVAINETGQAILGWRNSSGEARMRRRSAAGALGSEFVVASGVDAGTAVGIAGDGSAIAAFSDSTQSPRQVKTCVVGTDACIAGSAQTLHTTSDAVSSLRVAEDRSGAAMAAWIEADGSGRTTVYGAARLPGSTFNEVRSLAGDQSLLPGVGVSADGDGIVTYRFRDSNGLRMRFAGFDATKPRIALAQAANGVVGQPVAFSAVVDDVWGPFRVDWTFGDGASATGTSVSHVYTEPGTKPVGITVTDAAGNAATGTLASSISPPPSGDTGGTGGSGGTGGTGGTTTDTTGTTAGTGTAPTGGGTVPLPPPDRTAPRFTTKPAVSRKRFRAITTRATTAATPKGTVFTYALSEPAKVTIRIERRRSARPLRFAKAGKLTRLSKAGRTKLRFSGRIGSRSLKPGVYRATFTPRDAAGNTGKPARVSFTVVR
jgi:hypothetical protein